MIRVGDFRLSILRRSVRYRHSLALPRSPSHPASLQCPSLSRECPKTKTHPDTHRTPQIRTHTHIHTHTRRAAPRGGAGTPPAVPTLLWLPSYLPPSAATFLFRNPSTEARTAAPPKTGNTFPHLSHLRPISSQMVNKVESHCDTCDTFLRS